MEITMYDTLLQLPLFQGTCKNDFTNIIGKIKFHFTKHDNNETIANQGDKCNRLIFLLNGELEAEFVDSDGVYSINEIFKAPFVIEPYSLFGMKTHFQATYKTHNSAELVTISKSAILTELSNYEIFRLNYLNILSNRSQYAYDKLWNTHIGNVQEKITNFISLRCQKQEGCKTINIKMEDLAYLINETRINVSQVLNDMEKDGIIELKRKTIYIPELRNLLEYNK